MFTEELCKELDIGQTTITGLVKQGVLAKPEKIKGGKGKDKNSWTTAQVAEAKEKLKIIRVNRVQNNNCKRKDHVASEASADLLKQVFGVR